MSTNAHHGTPTRECCNVGLWQGCRKGKGQQSISVRCAGAQVLNKVDLLRGAELERLQAWLLDSSGASAVIPTSATQASARRRSLRETTKYRQPSGILLTASSSDLPDVCGYKSASNAGCVESRTITRAGTRHRGCE